ncbi:His_kinase domain-containing protein [Tenacibaculum sp. 190524A02b]|uniref:His_kinase domain-containing protein n=1 Tax=Tenacibaculum vairaonense TaxID=3137860 RepID=A0ABP1FFP6_9FLAO
MKKHFFIIVTGIIFGLLIGYYMFVSEQKLESSESFHLIVFSAIGIVTAYISMVLTNFLDIQFPWKKQIGNRLFLGILTHFMIAFLLFSFGVYGYLTNENGFSNTMLTHKLLYIKLAILLFLTTFIFQIIYFALYSYYSFSTLQIEAVKQERKQIEYQLNALKSQLSPHFLFNGLNTISSLIYKDTIKAALFIRKLAVMYKYTLKSYEVKLISLEEELEFVTSYNYLITTRFEKKYACTINISPEVLQSKVPPLAIQMLLENAVKHNVMSDTEPLNVSIENKGKYIVVRNNITKAPKKVISLNIGLQNINKRYLLLFSEGIITEQNSDFIVKLPIKQ